MKRRSRPLERQIGDARPQVQRWRPMRPLAPGSDIRISSRRPGVSGGQDRPSANDPKSPRSGQNPRDDVHLKSNTRGPVCSVQTAHVHLSAAKRSARTVTPSLAKGLAGSLLRTRTDLYQIAQQVAGVRAMLPQRRQPPPSPSWKIGSKQSHQQSERSGTQAPRSRGEPRRPALICSGLESMRIFSPSRLRFSGACRCL